MNTDDVGTRFFKPFKVAFGFHDHQVYIEDFAGCPPDLLNDGKTKGDVGDKKAIHHIEMKPVGLAFIEHGNIPFQVQEIGRKKGWRYEMGHDCKRITGQ